MRAVWLETTAGVGASFPILDRRFFVGVAHESRFAGDSVMLQFGIAGGELY